MTEIVLRSVAYPIDSATYYEDVFTKVFRDEPDTNDYSIAPPPDRIWLMSVIGLDWMNGFVVDDCFTRIP